MVYYLIIASISLCILFGYYWIFLRRSRKFNLNRGILLAIIVFVSLVPFFQFYDLANQLGFKKEWIEANKTIDSTTASFDQSDSYHSFQSSGSSLENSKWKLRSLWASVYVGGVIVGFLLYIMKLFRIIQIKRSCRKVEKVSNVYILHSQEIDHAFTFYQWIFIPDGNHISQRDIILEHERIHLKEKHWIDLLVGDFFKISFWFHPVSWLLRKEIARNHEYIVDQKICDFINKKEYQQILVEHALRKCRPKFSLFSSFIKNRISMMNQISPSKRSGLKYVVMLLLFLPCLGFEISPSLEETFTIDNHVNKPDSIDLDLYDSVLIFGPKMTKELYYKFNPGLKRYNMEFIIHKIDFDPESGLITYLDFEVFEDAESKRIRMFQNNVLGSIEPLLFFFDKDSMDTFQFDQFSLEKYLEIRAAYTNRKLRIGYGKISHEECLEIGGVLGN